MTKYLEEGGGRVKKEITLGDIQQEKKNGRENEVWGFLFGKTRGK